MKQMSLFWQLILTGLLVTLPLASQCPYETPIKIALHLCRSRHLPPKQVARLIWCIVQSDPLPADVVRAVFNKLHEVGPPPTLAQYPNLMETAALHFQTTPGFQLIMQELLLAKDTPNVRKQSLIWQITNALRYAQAIQIPETVLGFEELHNCPKRGHSHLFSIVSKEESGREIWTKCKNGPWRGNPFTSKFSQQLRQQNTIAQHAGEQTRPGPRYRLCSEYEPPENWREWFRQENIGVEVPTPESLLPYRN